MTTTATIDLSRLLTLPPPSLMAAASRKVATTPAVDAMLNRNAVVAVGVSGGKDSVAVALAVARHLDDIGHTGPRLLIHSDLGRVEWKDSLPACERLAARLGWQLVVVKRNAGDMLARWEGRWKANLRRYTELECVKLILPWSTPSMRFCTSELKTAIITSELRKRFPGQDILNVTGIRRQESENRAKMPVAAQMTALTRKHSTGFSWNAIIEWSLEEVLQEISDAGLALHEAYTLYGVSRVSCAFCIMSAWADLVAATGCEDNRELYVSMVEPEATSGFGFQGNRWLASVAPHWLSDELRERVAAAQEGAKVRVELEKLLPKHLHYTKGWPTALPSAEEAELIAHVRRGVAAVLGVEVKYTTGPEVLTRYQQLLDLKAAKGGAPAGADDDESEGPEAATDVGGMQLEMEFAA
jgi:3'-phosphoadenosine 5'-phosphosulfate sulfotransferase (PAPS reductase)/FAD synthetase